MNKDVKKDKEKKVSDKEKIKEAIKMLLSGYDRFLIFEHKYETKEFDEIEDALMDEMLFMVNGAKKELFKKRVVLFFTGMFFFPENTRKRLKADYKEIYKACKYLKKHKKELKKYMSDVKLAILDSKATWVDPIYHSGNNIPKRMTKSGYIELKDESGCWKPVSGTSFCRVSWSKKEIKELNNRLTLPKEVKLFEELEGIMELVDKSLVSSYRGKAHFSFVFYSELEKLIYEEFKVNIRRSSQRDKLNFKIHLFIDELWEKRTQQCTENSKNSSTEEKEDDSQS